MDVTLTTLFFFSALGGLFLGLFAGFVLRTFGVAAEDRKRFDKRELDGTDTRTVNRKRKEADKLAKEDERRFLKEEKAEKRKAKAEEKAAAKEAKEREAEMAREEKERRARERLAAEAETDAEPEAQEGTDEAPDVENAREEETNGEFDDAEDEPDDDEEEEDDAGEIDDEENDEEDDEEETEGASDAHGVVKAPGRLSKLVGAFGKRGDAREPLNQDRDDPGYVDIMCSSTSTDSTDALDRMRASQEEEYNYIHANRERLIRENERRKAKKAGGAGEAETAEA